MGVDKATVVGTDGFDSLCNHLPALVGCLWQTIEIVFAQMTPCANAESRPQTSIVLGLLAGVVRLCTVTCGVQTTGNGGGDCILVVSHQ